MPAGIVSVGVMADFLELIEQTDKAGLAVEAFAGKAVTSTRDASRAWAQYARAAKLSADEAQAGAERIAAAGTASFDTLSKSARTAGQSALWAARAVGESADQQTAAFAKAAAAATQLEEREKAAADAQMRLAAATKALSDAQAQAAAKVDVLSARLGGLGEHTAGVAKEISKLGGIGFAASIAGMGDLAAKYQQATEQIAANSDISSKAAAKIGVAFLGTSGSTIYSAKDLTEAFAAVAGQLKATEGQALNSAQALKVMSAAGDLAEATNTNLKDATAAVAMVMQGYGLSVNQASSASDLLFNTSRALNQPLGTVAQAINRLHGRLGTLAPTLADVGGLMVELGSHGVQGSRGVSVVNTAFQTLVGDAEPVHRMLGEMNVNLFDSHHRFIGLHEAITQLHPVFASMTQQAQDLAAKTLFGASAAQVMLAIIQRGPGAFDKATRAAQKMGTAHVAATDQSKTLGKQLDILKASVENDATALGLKLLPALTSVARGLQDGIGWLEKHKAAAEALGVAVGVVLAGALTVFAYQKATAFVTSIKEMGSGVGQFLGVLPGTQTETEALTAAIEQLTGALAPAESETATATAAVEALGSASAVAGGEMATMGAEVDVAAGELGVLGAAAAAATPEVVALDTATTGLLARFAALAPAAAAAGAAALLLKGDSNMKTYPKHPPGLPQIDVPKEGESRLAYIKASLGLPPNYKGGPITAASYKGPGLDHKTIDSFFKWLGGAGQFGKHGFMPAGTGGMSLSKSWLAAGQSIPGFSPTEQTNASAIMAALTRGGLSTAGAAAITGNWVQESGLNPSEHGGLLAQWGGSRLTNEMNFAKSKGLAYNSIPAESQFALHELQGTPGLLKMLQSGKYSPQQLALAVENKYEEPLGTKTGAGYFTPDTYWSANTAGRESYAASIYSAFSGKQTSGNLLGITRTAPAFHSPATNSSLSQSILNIGSGGKLPVEMLYESERGRATQLADQASRQQAMGQAQVTVLQSINQQLQDKGSAIVQKLSDAQAIRNEAGSPKALRQMTEMILGSGGNANINAAMRVALPGGRSPGQASRLQLASQTYTDIHGITANASDSTLRQMQGVLGKSGGSAEVQAIKNLQQMLDDRATEQLTAMKDQQAIRDQASAILVQQIKNQTQRMEQRSAIQVAAINASASRITDALSASATFIGDNAQTNADTINERGLYGLKLVAQQLQVVSDKTKAGFDRQIATDQAKLDKDQGRANIENARAQLATDQVTATQNLRVLQAQQNVNLVSLKETALEAKAQQNLDAITARQDAKEAAAKLHLDLVTARRDSLTNAAKAHADATTISQDQRILRATQHADAVQLQVDTRVIGPAQTAVDLSANADKTTQAKMAAQLKLATAQGDVQVNAAQLQLARVTSSANDAIASAQGAAQTVQNTSQVAIQNASDQYANAQNTANRLIQLAQSNYSNTQNTANRLIQQSTDTYQTIQDAANKAIASATFTQASTAAGWAAQLAQDQAMLSGTQGRAAVGEAGAQANVTNMQALASTQFAGSGLVVNMYGTMPSNPAAVGDEISWAIRSSGLATV